MEKPEPGAPIEGRLEFPEPPPTEPVGELQLWASTSEPDQVSVSLLFNGETVDPDVVTHLLGVSPTVLKRPGHRSTQRLFASLETGYWRLMTSDRVRESSLEALILDLLARLPPPGPRWDALRPLNGQLFCGLFLEVWNRECHLSPAVLGAVIERHLTLRLDMYYEPGNPLSASDEDEGD
jgi:hypothetical protein